MRGKRVSISALATSGVDLRDPNTMGGIALSLRSVAPMISLAQEVGELAEQECAYPPRDCQNVADENKCRPCWARAAIQRSELEAGVASGDANTDHPTTQANADH